MFEEGRNSLNIFLQFNKVNTADHSVILFKVDKFRASRLPNKTFEISQANVLH